MHVAPCLASVCLILAFGVAAGGEDPRPRKSSVLIVDGVNNHDWPRNTRLLKSILEGSGLFTVDVSTSPPATAPAADWDAWRPQFSKYDVVVMNFNSGPSRKGVRWPRPLEKDLEDYVSGGGGLVSYHAANNSFPDWPAYNDMIGLGWREKSFGPSLVVSGDGKVVTVPAGQGNNPGHGPEHDFQVTTLDADHPITKGLPRVWMHPHEQLTHGQHGPAKNLTVLTYAWSKDTKENEVMDWVIPYGKGRVYTTMLGHLWKDGPDTAVRCVGFQTMFVRGVEWAATGAVTYPVPSDFPTATEIKLKPPTDTPDLDAEPKSKEDRTAPLFEDGRAVIDITSPRGIGSATVTRTFGRWPNPLALRLHLRGLESLAVSTETTTWTLSVPAEGETHIHLSHDNQEDPPLAKDSPYWTEVKKVGQGDAAALEVTVPQPLLDDATKQITVKWIDFYRQ